MLNHCRAAINLSYQLSFPNILIISNEDRSQGSQLILRTKQQIFEALQFCPLGRKQPMTVITTTSMLVNVFDYAPVQLYLSK